jgi:hypothetical protein
LYEKKNKTVDLEQFEQQFSQENEMVIEDETVPVHVKDEKKSIREFKSEVAAKNKRLFYVSHFFSNEYIRFLETLKKNFESSPHLKNNQFEIIDSTLEDMEQPTSASRNSLDFIFFEFVTKIYFSTILRTSERNIQEIIFEWIELSLSNVNTKNNNNF